MTYVQWGHSKQIDLILNNYYPAISDLKFGILKGCYLGNNMYFIIGYDLLNAIYIWQNIHIKKI